MTFTEYVQLEKRAKECGIRDMSVTKTKHHFK